MTKVLPSDRLAPLTVGAGERLHLKHPQQLERETRRSKRFEVGKSEAPMPTEQKPFVPTSGLISEVRSRSQSSRGSPSPRRASGQGRELSSIHIYSIYTLFCPSAAWTPEAL